MAKDEARSIGPRFFTVSEEGRVAVHFRIRGTHRGEFMGAPPSGAVIDVGAIAILEVANGKVRALDAVFDRAGLMEQLAARERAR